MRQDTTTTDTAAIVDATTRQWLAQGGGETDLMRLAGWKSRAMLGR